MALVGLHKGFQCSVSEAIDDQHVVGLALGNADILDANATAVKGEQHLVAKLL